MAVSWILLAAVAAGFVLLAAAVVGVTLLFVGKGGSGDRDR